MSVHASADQRRLALAPAAKHAVVVCLAALVVTGAGCWWAVLAAPAAVRGPLAWGGGAAAVVLTAAVTAAVYYAETLYRSRGMIDAAWTEADQLKLGLTQLAEETVPLLVRRLREGMPPEAVAAEIPWPDSSAVRLLLGAVTHEVAAAEQRATGARAARASLEAEIARLSDETMPLALGRLREGAAADVALAGLPDAGDEAVRGLLTGVVEEVAAAERRGAAAMAACASAAARFQAQTTRMLAELREMENRYGDDKVFADLMELDHRVSQLGRLADSIALLAGGRSGRRWTKPIPMESILRGGMGRIDAYQRVRMHSVSSAAVVGYAAEGVMHALAELMDNAAAFSAHGSEVHVYVEDEDVGVVITIEDSGLGMRKRERQRAEGSVSRSLDLATLAGTRMGLAVVGRLASRYGLSVNFRPSSRGGTGVVVMVPRQLIAQPRLDAPGFYAPASEPAQAGQPSVSEPVPGEPSTGPSSTGPSSTGPSSTGPSSTGPSSTGEPSAEPSSAPSSAGPPSFGQPSAGLEQDLPKRPRGVTLAAASGGQPGQPGQPGPAVAAPPAPPPAPPPEAPRDTAARFAAFREAGERSRSTSGSHDDDETT
jgi:signal transduction histidine kinase